MIYARDYRRIARESLRGFWPTAILASFVSGLLGASMGSGFSLNFNFGQGADNTAIDPYALEQFDNSAIRSFVESDFFMPLMAFFGTIIILLAIYSLVCIIIGGAVTLGYAQFNLNLVDGNDARVGDLFSHMNRLWAGFCMQFFRGLFVLLWTLLLIIPGILASYSYAMTPYIYAEHPELRAREAIRQSKIMMKGNRWRLFCLELSFIGWELLILLGFCILLIAGVFTEQLGAAALGALLFAVGYLFLCPYMEAARAAFYREISDQRYSNPQPEAQWREVPPESNEEEMCGYHNDTFY